MGAFGLDDDAGAGLGEAPVLGERMQVMLPIERLPMGGAVAGGGCWATASPAPSAVLPSSASTREPVRQKLLGMLLSYAMRTRRQRLLTTQPRAPARTRMPPPRLCEGLFGRNRDHPARNA